MGSSEAMSERYRAAFPSVAHLWDEDRSVWVVRTGTDLEVGVLPLMFTAAVFVGTPGAPTYHDRWCYDSVPAAFAAAAQWDGTWPGTEPDGWHRHPATGRRRTYEPLREHIAL